METVAAAPRTPGVHVVLDGDEIIYVGFTGRELRDRMRQHLTGNRKSSVLHDQVGQELDHELGRQADTVEIAERLNRCEIRWRETDDPEGLKKRCCDG
ncbi:hypothetical protein [Micromonospora psammae]|uniref:hypothetical protein n=1 Tax=Micromonospora sp. CPCC 205556 TaxID=3122398 RepID=UPI002FEE6D7B